MMTRNKEVIDILEKREAKYRKQISKAKKEGDKSKVKYLQGHLHEIDNLLFLLKEA